MNLPEFDPNSTANDPVCFCCITLNMETDSIWMPQAPLVSACEFDRIDILEKLLNMETIDLSAEFVFLFSFIILTLGLK